MLEHNGPASLIRMKDVWKSYGSHEVLRGVDLEVRAGDVLCLIGPSGCGKSTALRSINALETIDRGSIEVCGKNYQHTKEPVHKIRQETAMVFQRFELFPHLTVLENVALAPRLTRGLTRHQADRRAIELLSKVGLENFTTRFPAKLSGGQQQRVGIARALANEPKVLLCDEPTSALDPELVHEVTDILQRLALDGMTMLIVTHEMNFAKNVATACLFLDEGKIVEQAPPQVFFGQPRNERLKLFLKAIS